VPDSAFFFEMLWWFLGLLSCGFGNPVPEEIMVIGAGIRTAQLGEYGLFRWLLLPVVMVGGVMADIVLYMLGRLFGTRLFETRLMMRIAPPEKREHIRVNFDRYGIAIFVVGRLVPGIRTTLFLTAGSMRLSLVRFIIADGLGAMLGASLFFMLGFGLGASFKDIIVEWEQKIIAYGSVLLLIALVVVGCYLLYSFLRDPIPTGDPKEVPLIGSQIAAAIPDQHVAPEETPRVEEPAPAARVEG
jgi:membrane protein DedA with SNARE-associated domain